MLVSIPSQEKKIKIMKQANVMEDDQLPCRVLEHELSDEYMSRNL